MKKIDSEIFAKEFPITDNKILASKYKCSESFIRVVGASYGLKKANWEWSKKDEAYLLKNYELMTVAEICQELDRSKWSVINKYRELTGKTKNRTISKLK